MKPLSGRLPRPLRHPRARAVVRPVSRLLTALDRHLIRTGRRAIGQRVARDAPVLLLTTTGRRTGRARTTPLLFHRRADGTLLLIAANGGAAWKPDWLLNVSSNAAVRVDLDGMQQTGHARVLEPKERAERWSEATAAFPGLEETQRLTARPIDLVQVVLTG